MGESAEAAGTGSGGGGSDDTPAVCCGVGGPAAGGSRVFIIRWKRCTACFCWETLFQGICIYYIWTAILL